MTSACGPYVVQYDPKALKELTELDKPVARRIVKAVDALNADLWRIRVGHYRVIYTIKDAELVVLALRVASGNVRQLLVEAVNAANHRLTGAPSTTDRPQRRPATAMWSHFAIRSQHPAIRTGAPEGSARISDQGQSGLAPPLPLRYVRGSGADSRVRTCLHQVRQPGQ